MQQNVIVPTLTTIHPLLGVFVITDVQDILKNVCNGIQAKHHICLTDYDYDYILDEIKRRGGLSFKLL